MEIDYADLRSMVYEAELDFENSVDEIIRPDYSGRYMYGATCLGIVIHNTTDIYSFMYGLGLRAERTGEDMSEWTNPSEDSMGRSTILYWRDITVVNVPEDRE